MSLELKEGYNGINDPEKLDDQVNQDITVTANDKIISNDKVLNSMYQRYSLSRKKVDDYKNNFIYKNKFERLITRKFNIDQVEYIYYGDTIPLKVLNSPKYIETCTDYVKIYPINTTIYVVAKVIDAFDNFENIYNNLPISFKVESYDIDNNNHNNSICTYKNCPVYESEDDADKNLPHDSYHLATKLYLVPEVPTIKVRYHKEICPELIEMEKIDKGDFIDLRSAENVSLKQGEFKLISLGISIQLPAGYHAEVVPRSSTYKNFGIIMSNSIGIIDESYCGDNDIWRFPAIAMRDTEIKVNDRICQFRIVKNRDIKIEVVDKLDNEDRGGIGSTGKN